MPIYAYKCESCGHRQDVLQKISDPVLTVCPQCSQATFAKQVTAAGFQLKGSGWYVTDFRGGSASAPPSEGAAASGSTAPSATPATSATPAATAAPTASAASNAAPASAPASPSAGAAD